MTTTCTTVFNLNDSQSLELDSSTEMESKGATPTSSKGKRQLPSVPVLGSPMHACLKTVTFNSELRKASVGGTESVGEIRPESLSVSLNFDSTDGNSGTCSKIQIKSPSKSSKENTDPNEVFLFPENDVEGSDLKSEISNFSKSSTPLVHICEKKITCQRNGKDNWSVSEETRCKNVKTPNKTPTIKTPLRTPATDGKFKVASGNLSARSNKSFTTPGNTDSFSTPAKEPRRVTIEGTPIPCPDFLEGELPSPSVMRTPVLTPSRRYTLDDRIIKTPECYSTVQMDLNGYDVLYGRDRLADGEDSSSVTVAVRVRPFMPRELLEEKVPRCIISMNGNETTVTTDSGVVHQFTYDFSFWSVDANHGKYDGQENVYKMLAQPLLGKAFEGYNTCLFAYGQTGSGKSYSIMGHGNEIGIIPRFCEELFSRAEVTRDSDENVFKRTGVNINVEISFFEIYNEKIHDLLASSKEKGGKKPTLRVREHPVLGPYVEGLSTYVTNSFEDVQGWINLGNKNRATAATGMNDKSSRSHSVFTLVLTQTRTDEIEGQEHEHSITSKINLVDLAGSERQSLAQTSGQRLREGANINKSLLTLGKVISALSEQNPNVARKKKLFIPYRDSVLTWLLKESLGGNSKTAMIATISPSIHHIEETLSTLRYANQARTIVNLARVNEDPKAKIIRELRDEIDRLKSQSMYMSDDVHTASLMEIATLREKLLSKEKEMEEMTRSWQHRFKQSEQRKVEEAKMLEKAGITFKVDNKLPNLVNLNEDPQLSDLLLYVIKEGQTRVGRMCAGSGHEIQLNGALIADDHCIINNEGSLVSITPIGDAQTYVNGNLISEPVILHHGDRVIVGGDHYFRFNHPHEVRNKVTSGSQEMKDFDFARQELLQVQEARLQHELEEARKKAQEEVEKARREAEEELNSQKTGYEEKLVELEKTLKDQTLEALKALQSRQEAEDTIQQLKQQKMILEQEVVAGRRRQEIEAKAAQKVSLMYGEKSKLLILLETERKKVQQRIQEMKQRKSETASPCRRYQSAENQLPGKTDLYKVALLIREANKIGQFLKKNMEFSREDYMEEESTKTLIKVTDTKLSVCTYWTVPKFEEKLMQMRDMYQNETDGVGDDQVFHDPGDNWEYDEKSSPLRSPKGRVSFMRSNSRSFLSSVSSSIDSPFKIQGDRTSPTNVAVVDQESQTNSTASMAALCRGILLDDLEKCNAYYFEESVADKVLHMCEMLVRDVQKLADGSHAHRVTFAGLDISQDMQSTCVQVLNQVQLLTSQCAVWSSSVSQGRSKSSATTDIFLKLQEHVKAMRSHIVLLFQGFENGLDGLVQEACNNVKDSASSICRLAGELSLVTSTPVLSLDEEADEGETIHLSPFVSQSFLAGCDTQVDRHLQKSIKALEECEERMQKLVETAADNLELGEIPQNVSILICTCKLLLSICQEVQVEVDSSMRESLDLFPGQYYSLGYQRLQGMMGNVDKLMESINLLMQNIQPVVDGKERDLRKLCRCAELIQKGAARLLESATRDVKNYQDTTCSSFTDLSVLTDTQTEQLEFATQDINLAANSLIANAMKIVEHENFSVTPRKRMLPASPNKSVIGSPYSPMRTTPSSKS